MHLTHPLKTIAPSLDMGVLECVARSTRIYSIGEIADFTEASRPGARLAAERLTTGGLLEPVTVGRSRGYRLNRDHVLTPSILAALQAPSVLRSRIGDLVAEWPLPADRVILFGSGARGEADADSDLDLLIIPSDPAALDDEGWAEQVLDLVMAIRRWTGNGCDVITLTAQDWADAVEAEEALAGEVERDGIVLLKSPGTPGRPRGRIA